MLRQFLFAGLLRNHRVGCDGDLNHTRAVWRPFQPTSGRRVVVADAVQPGDWAMQCGHESRTVRAE